MKRTRKLVWIGLAVVLILLGTYFGPKLVQGEIRPLVVLSESMTPTLQLGDLMVVKRAFPEEVKIGDILIFKDPSGRENVLITHRVVSQSKEGFQTKGDANEEPDRFLVKPEDVVGRPLLRIPYLGYLFGFRYLKGSQRFLVFAGIVLLPAGLLISDEIRTIFADPIKLRKKERQKDKIEKRKKRRKSIKL